MKRYLGIIIATLLFVFMAACSSGSGGRPKNFAAELAAPDVVMLSWEAVEGATGYLLELSIDHGNFFSMIALPPEYTTYEDLTAPENGNLTYQVQAITESGPAGKSQVEITTGARQPNPAAVHPEYDEANAAAVVIGAQGGTLSLIDSNGVEFSLSIPEGALSTDTEIRMTAVSAVSDWPLDGGAIGAVRLEPASLLLNDVATLTIGIPADANPDLATVGFAFQADGSEFTLQPAEAEIDAKAVLPTGGAHLARPDFQPPPIRRIVLPVMELKVGGVGTTSHESVSRFVRDHAPSNSGAALEQKRAAAVIADDELTPLKGFGDPALEESYQIGKAVSDAKTCGELNSQIVAFQKWRFTSSYLGLNPDQRRDYTSFIWDEITDKVKAILENAADECEKSSGQGSSAAGETPCVKALLAKIANPPANTASDFNWDLRNKLDNKLSDEELQDIQDKLDKCEKKVFTVAGTSGEVSFSGTICSLDEPFVLNETFPGGSGAQTFTPSSATGGEVVESSSGQGCVASGEGSYTVAVNEDSSGTLEWTVTATLTCPDISNTRTVTFTLPLQPAPAGSCP